jgi:hypothetical protein
MLALSDNQLAAVMTAAGKLPTEKRGVSLERVVARLGPKIHFMVREPSGVRLEFAYDPRLEAAPSGGDQLCLGPKTGQPIRARALSNARL